MACPPDRGKLIEGPPWLGTHFVRFALYNPAPMRGVADIYDESWAAFRGGNWRCDFRLGGGGDFGGSRNSSRRVRAEHAALRQDRRRSAALARRAAQTGIRPNRRADEEAECVFHPLYQAGPRFQSPPAFRVGLFGGDSRQWRVARPRIRRAGSRAVRRQRPRLPKSFYLLVQPQERKGLSRTALRNARRSRSDGRRAGVN